MQPNDQSIPTRPTDITREKGTVMVPGLRTPEIDTKRAVSTSVPSVATPAIERHTIAVEDDNVEVSMSAAPMEVRGGELSDTLMAPMTEPISVPQRPLSATQVVSPPSTVVTIEETGHLDEFLVHDAPPQVPAQDILVGTLSSEPTVSDMVHAAEQDIDRIIADRAKLEEHTAELVRERKKIEDELVPLKREQENFDIRLGDLEKSERTAFDSKSKRANEEDRWGLIEERYQNELRVVQCRERLEKVADDILHDEITYKELIKEEELLRKRIETMEAEGKKRELEKTLNDAMQKRKSVEGELEKLGSEKMRIVDMLSSLGQKEAGIESRTGKLGELEAGARSAGELKRLAEERYQLEKERHETERARWQAEDDIALLESQYQGVAQRLAEAEARQVEVERKIRELGLS